MHAFATLTAILSITGAALASCSQADRFGVTTVSNSAVKPGDVGGLLSFTVHILLTNASLSSCL